MDQRELAQDLMAYVPLPPTADRLVRHDAVLSWRPGPVPFFANVSAVRTSAEELPLLVEAARRWFGDHNRENFTWFLGPASAPGDAAGRLLDLGAEPFGGGTSMLLTAPPPAPDGIDIRPVSSAGELLTFRLLMTEAGGGALDEVTATALRAGNDQAWQDHLGQAGRSFAFLAYLDEAPVAAGGLLLTDHGVGVLSGGGTATAARGRGCYRALVHARWATAQRAGMTALAVQASELSAPILARMGFAEVCKLAILRQTV